MFNGAIAKKGYYAINISSESQQIQNASIQSKMSGVYVISILYETT